MKREVIVSLISGAGNFNIGTGKKIHFL